MDCNEALMCGYIDYLIHHCLNFSVMFDRKTGQWETSVWDDKESGTVCSARNPSFIESFWGAIRSFDMASHYSVDKS